MTLGLFAKASFLPVIVSATIYADPRRMAAAPVAM